MESGIYKIKNILTGEFYIGSSKCLKRRWIIHSYKLKKGNHANIILQRAWNKYGEDNIKFEVIEFCEKDKLFEREQYYLDDLKPKYNISFKADGGDNLTNHPDRDNIIKKMAKTNKEKYEKLSENEKIKYSEKYKGMKNPNFGNKWTKEMRENMSKKIKEYFKNHQHYKTGKKHEEIYGEEKAKEINDKLSKTASSRIGDKNVFFGKHHSEKTKNHLREIRIGKYPGEQNIPFRIDGISYESLGTASKELNIPATTIRWRLKSKNPKFINYQYITPLLP